MPGKTFQSKLSPHEDKIFALLDSGRSFRQVAEQLNRFHNLGVPHIVGGPSAPRVRERVPLRCSQSRIGRSTKAYSLMSSWLPFPCVSADRPGRQVR